MARHLLTRVALAPLSAAWIVDFVTQPFPYQRLADSQPPLFRADGRECSIGAVSWGFVLYWGPGRRTLWVRGDPGGCGAAGLGVSTAKSALVLGDYGLPRLYPLELERSSP